jgi:hypothetical protein
MCRGWDFWGREKRGIGEDSSDRMYCSLDTILDPGAKVEIATGTGGLGTNGFQNAFSPEAAVNFPYSYWSGIGFLV